MPIYKYRCPKCGHNDEAIQKMGEDKLACPKCRAAMDRALTSAAFALKGGGWAADGYKSTPKDSIPCADFEGGLMESAKKGPAGVSAFQKRMADKYS